MDKKALRSLIVLIGILQGCASSPAPSSSGSLPPPKPAVSEYVETEGGGFTVQDGTEVRYGMTYLLRKEIGEAPSYMVEFENPVAGEKPLANGGMLEPSQTQIVVTSPLLPCIENHRNYKVSLKLFSGGNLVAQHDDEVQFSVPASLLRGVDLRECPVAGP
jgi:hypothetical protein